MTCAACGDVPIGVLNGEPICGSCAAMASFAEGKTEPGSVTRNIALSVAAAIQRDADPTEIEELVASAVRVRQRRRDEDFYRRARRIQQSGGCRQ